MGHLAGRCTQRRIDAALAYAVAKWDPKKLREAEEQARDARHLDLELPGQNCRPSSVATAAIRGQLSPTDAMKFDALVAAQAARLAEQGDTSSLDIRRSKALGAIADALMTGELDLTTSEQGDVPAKRRSSLPATLFVHVRVEDLLATCPMRTGSGWERGSGPQPWRRGRMARRHRPAGPAGAGHGPHRRRRCS
ncbi:MAG: DUF222 domain-containing protein [Marmoricola sp.]